MNDPVIVVTPLPVGGWTVALEDDGQRQYFLDRYRALEYAHLWAQDARPSLVRVMAVDGSIEDEWAYGAFKGKGARMTATDHRLMLALR